MLATFFMRKPSKHLSGSEVAKKKCVEQCFKTKSSSLLMIFAQEFQITELLSGVCNLSL